MTDTNGKTGLAGLESDDESTLRLAEERYRTIIRTAMDGFWIVDPTGRFIDVNDAYCALTGYGREELLSMRISDVEASETPEATARHIALIMEAGHDRFETRHRRKDGRILDIEVSANYTDSGGGFFFVFIRDITERKRSAEELAVLSSALDQSPSPVIITDIAGSIEYVNRSFTESMEVSFVEAVGTTPCFLDRSESTNGYIDALWETVRGGGTWRGDVCCVTGGGKTRWDLVTVSPIRDSRGQISHFIAARLDDTERRRAEEALRESEARYRMLHSAAFDGVIIADAEGRITESNPSAERMFGYGRGELSGREIVELVPERFRAAHLAGFRRFVKTGESRSRGKALELEGLKKDGTTFPIELIIGSFELNGRGCFTGTFRDITERKRLETEVLKTQKLESLGVLAGGIAHNFNNIMTAILGNIFLAKGSAAGDGLKRLDEAERGIDRAKELTERLLTFSRGGSPVKRLASIAGLVKESTDFVLSGTTVRPEYSVPDGLWAVEADEGLISQVIRNLVMNAVQAMPRGGVVKVACENAEVSGGDSPLSEGSYVKISVEDSGAGIQRENLQRIFDPYFTTKDGGAGLGLSASYSIIKNHDGHISVESTPGLGSVFFFFLPASKRTGPEPAKAGAAVVSGSGRVLVMDDEEVVRNTAGNILEVLGYIAAYAKDGEEAIRAYIGARDKGEPFDAVLMDLTVPGGMGGKETIARLLQIDPSVKAIVSSGYSNDPVMSDFLKFGFKAVIPKPYSVAEFSATIRKVITGG